MLSISLLAPENGHLFWGVLRLIRSPSPREHLPWGSEQPQSSGTRHWRVLALVRTISLPQLSLGNARSSLQLWPDVCHSPPWLCQSAGWGVRGFRCALVCSMARDMFFGEKKIFLSPPASWRKMLTAAQGWGGLGGDNARNKLCLEIIALSFTEVLVPPCWQLQELAGSFGDTNTEAKLLLLIITCMRVRRKRRYQGRERETVKQRGCSWGSPAQGWHILGGAQPWRLLLHQRGAGFMPRVCAHAWDSHRGPAAPALWNGTSCSWFGPRKGAVWTMAWLGGNLVRWVLKGGLGGWRHPAPVGCPLVGGT